MVYKYTLHKEDVDSYVKSARDPKKTWGFYHRVHFTHYSQGCLK